MAALTNPEVIRAVERRLQYSTAKVRGEMNRRLDSLASLGVTAPFVGFLGACVGIVAAFKGCGGEKWACLAATVEGIAEGIVPAALGLLVAIPTWWCYKYLTSRVEDFEFEMETASIELLNYLVLNRSLISEQSGHSASNLPPEASGH